MSLLSLDLATVVGWTVGDVSERDFAHGTHHLPKTGDDIGAFARAYNRWLCDMITANEVDHVVFEAPILTFVKTNLTTLRKLYGLTWHTEFVAGGAGIRVEEAHQQSVRKYMTGSGRGGKDTKQRMIDAVRLRGYEPLDHNAADAIGIRLYAIANLYPADAAPFDDRLGPLGVASRS